MGVMGVTGVTRSRLGVLLQASWGRVAFQRAPRRP